MEGIQRPSSFCFCFRPLVLPVCPAYLLSSHIDWFWRGFLSFFPSYATWQMLFKACDRFFNGICKCLMYVFYACAFYCAPGRCLAFLLVSLHTSLTAMTFCCPFACRYALIIIRKYVSRSTDIQVCIRTCSTIWLWNAMGAEVHLVLTEDGVLQCCHTEWHSGHVEDRERQWSHRSASFQLWSWCQC